MSKSVEIETHYVATFKIMRVSRDVTKDYASPAVYGERHITDLGSVTIQSSDLGKLLSKTIRHIELVGDVATNGSESSDV